MTGTELPSKEPLFLKSLADVSALECFHSGQRHQLYRARSPDGSIVVKTIATGLTAERIASVRHEYELLQDLDIPGVVQVLGLTQVNERLALLMADAGDSNLAARIRTGPLTVPEFLELAVQLATTVAHLHRARIVHRDINPSNIVWNAAARRAALCDFGIASTLAALTVQSASPQQLEGTLAYIAPEQTGRTGRAVDSRTDLYSLGASFYAMLTGTPPFVANDPIELVHAHIARHPRPPHELNTAVPPQLSLITLKLLEKEPEQRYQTAEALLSDLQEAQTRWSQAGAIAPFPLASHDVPRELHIPAKLYGRDRELQTLHATFTRACQGQRAVVLITGAPGIGKSALVSQLGSAVAEHRGFFISGKFDQLQRSVPFSGLSQALRALVRQLLVEPQTTLQQWRERIEAAVTPNGQLLVEIVPELAHILGAQPCVPEIGPVESKNRFHLVCRRFLAVFTQREHPLTLFLDDLQWVDAASLELLEQWLGDAGCRHLLLIGAYRDSDVAAAHPLMLALAAWRTTDSVIHELHLEPIDHDDIAQLTAATFNQDVSDTRALADLIMRKTAGNPFFVRWLLHLLHAQGLMYFQSKSRTWAWNVEELEHIAVTDNVLELMVQAIERLPAATRSLLEVGACIGHRFDLNALAEVSGLPRTLATDRLWPALEDGLLVPLQETYKAPRHAGPLEERLDTLPAQVQFAHDRVQQAVYSTLSEAQRRGLHLAIGRRLRAAAGEEHLDECLFDIIDQLVLGEGLIVEPDERLRLVELLLAAGRKAKASAAYQAACDYLNVAMRHLSQRCWEEHPKLTFALYRELAEAAYLTGRHASAEALIETALAHAPSSIAKADLYTLRVLAATVVGDWPAALRSGRDGLAVFGLAWPLDGLAEANEAEAAAVMRNVGARRIADLVYAPEVQDEEIRASMRLLSILVPPAYFSGAEVLTFLVSRATNLSLQFGPSPYSAYAYVFYGVLHNTRTGEYDVGFAFGELALALARRFENRAEESRTLEVFGLVVHHWKAPVRDSLPLLREGFRAGFESGEVAYAAFNLSSILINSLPSGVPLSDLLSDAEVAIEFATKHGNRTSVEISLPFRQFARALKGTTRAAGSFDDESFETARFLEEAKDNHTALGNFWVTRLQAAYVLGDYATARRSSQEGARHILTGILGMVPSAEHVFYSALTLAAEHSDSPSIELLELHRQLLDWAKHCPRNFAHKAALVGAEVARISGAPATAMKLYRAALDGAVQQQCIQDEALAHELRARFLGSEQEPALAAVHFRAARDRYEQWGAAVKARAIELECPDSCAPEIRTTTRQISIDALALIKASQAISAETVPEQLFEQILRVVVEAAGAQKGALVLCESNELIVRARIATAAKVSVSLAATLLDECLDLPAAIIRYVARMQEPLVLANVAATETFAADPTVRQRNLRSVLCVPLTQQAKVVGLLYLENDAMAGAFADELVEIVQVLAAQAVISLENARLHQASQQEIEQRKQAEASLSEIDRRKDEFLAMLAHELRNPLAPISSANEVLARLQSGDARAQSAIGIIRRQVTQLTRLVDDLLDVSRVTQGRIQLTRELIDLSRVVAHAVETAEPLLLAKQHRVSIVASHERLYVDGDFVRLAQCLGNILTNAAKYTEAGGEIRVRSYADGTTAVVEIADSGAGISPQLLPRVFDLFVQSDRTLDRAQGGLGMGLAIVKRLVEMHGGEVTASSDGEGRGSMFALRLPRISQPAAADTASPQPTSRKRRVLVIDDNEDAAESLALLLSLQNHETVVALSGKEALDRLPSFLPDLILLDLGLPEMNGYEVLPHLRTMLGARPVRVVALSGYGQPEDRERSKRAGFDDHLVKPPDMAVLECLLADLD